MYSGASQATLQMAKTNRASLELLVKQLKSRAASVRSVLTAARKHWAIDNGTHTLLLFDV